MRDKSYEITCTHSGPDSTPIYVDLEGTLVSTDLLWESLITLVRTHPVDMLRVPLWALRGRSYLKHQLADRVELDVKTLPYRPELLRYLEAEKLRGRRRGTRHRQ